MLNSPARELPSSAASVIIEWERIASDVESSDEDVALQQISLINFPNHRGLSAFSTPR
jgi:hypothetical protein